MIKNLFFIFFIVLMIGKNFIRAQGRELASDTINKKTTKDTNSTNKKKWLAEDAIDANVNYEAKDSIVFDVKNKTILMYGNSKANYKNISLKSSRIDLDITDNVLEAYGTYNDSIKKYRGEPIFKEGKREFKSHRIKYNFKTKKGLIKEVITNEGEGYIHGGLVKRQTKEFYVKNSRYTTCNLKKPHFYIKSKKLKVIPNDKIITGPAVLYIEDVPTPLALPFGFFPSSKKRNSGVVIPEPGNNNQYGIFLINGGYYLALSKYFDFKNTFDFYSKGSWATKANINYKARYRFTGYLNFSFSNFINGRKEFNNFQRKQDFFFSWRHNQNSKSTPNSSFSANVNFGTSNNFRNNFNNSSSSFLTNNFNSTISYYKRWEGTPFSINVLANHSQNNVSKSVNIKLPDITFNISQVYLFQKKGNFSNKWYQKIYFSYSTNARYEINTFDSLLTFKDIDFLKNNSKNGVSHSLPIAANFKLLKHITFTPSIKYNAAWYFNRVNKKVENNRLITDTINDFNWLYNWSFGVGFSTNIYGMYKFKSKKIKAIRHIMSPRISFNYVPENNFGQYIYRDTVGNFVKYSTFENGLYGTFNNTLSQSNINLSLNNVVVAKKIIKPKASDSIQETKYEKQNLLDNLTISTNYNLLAKTNKWSDININTGFKLLKRITVNWLTTLDLYIADSSGIKLADFEWDKNKRLARIKQFNLSFYYNLSGKGIGKSNKQKISTPQFGMDRDYSYILANQNKYIDFNIPWDLSISYNLFYNKVSEFINSNITQTFNINGNVNLTDNWKIGISSGYDFSNHGISYSTVNIYRNLHCWEIQFNWIPLGVRESFLFTIRAKSSILQDLKLVRKNLPSIF